MVRTRSLDDLLRTAVTRRGFVAGGLAMAVMPYARLLAQSSRAAAPTPLKLGTTPFTLGIASGDPSPDGMVLWTRLAPEPLSGGGMPPVPVSVFWQVATDERMANIVASGAVPASPQWAHSVHVEVTGLQPARWYWYRFRAGGHVSAIGRTRTFPLVTTAADRLRFAFASCQHFETGLFTAYQHLAAEDLDLVFHLGDYIYEGEGRDNQVRRHVGPEPTTLEEYRNRHAQYKTDAHLQAAHASFPWIVTPDDHEVDNNYANDISEHDDSPVAFLLRRAAAYHAYYEHMPLRPASIPRGPTMRLYRSFKYGTLASFLVLDTRQYRTDQPCNDGTKVTCEGTYNPRGTIMGDAQERWLFNNLSASPTEWNVIPQQVMMARVDQFPGEEKRYSMDQWPGYEMERRRVMEFLHRRRPRNPVVLTGDIHSNWVNDLTIDSSDPKSPTVGTEFVGTSITSGGDGVDLTDRIKAVLAENPFVKFQSGQRGYVRCEVTPKTMRADYQVVEYVSRPDAPKITRASFVVESGKPGAQVDTINR